MTEAKRKPAFWVIKDSRGKYAFAGAWHERVIADQWESRSEAEAYLRGFPCPARVVPVYVTTRKVKRGHSWSWACKRMLEGKRVRRANWAPGEVRYLSTESGGYFAKDAGTIKPVFVGCTRSEMSATDWQVCE